MTLRFISYGGGVQSTALVVLAALRDPRLEAAMGGPVDAAILGDADELIEYAATSYRSDRVLGPGRHLLSAVGDAARSGGAT